MNEVDRFLIRNGFNLDGSKIKKNQASKQNKNNLKTERLLASKGDIQRLKYKKWKIEDRKSKS